MPQSTHMTCSPESNHNEFLFTDNASTDATFERLADEARSDDRIRVLRFTRNFGFQTSILTNYLPRRALEDKDPSVVKSCDGTLGVTGPVALAICQVANNP
jgi:hypothetical protein